MLALAPAALLLVSSMAMSASACTTIYAGSSMTADGSVFYGRSEDYANSQNKLFYVSPAGQHKEGELYYGCYGFTWTFTHDSYGYTAFSDDNREGAGGICPDCGGDHAHTPYEAGGTNDMGVTITATETLHSSEAAAEADPYEDLGIEEAEIVTVVLGEAATAREAVDLLLGIYDTAGCNAGSGIIIGDASETWYIENVTGHQYIALKLSDSMVFIQPNMSVIGEIDLDDTENVIASAGLIETAVNGGFFVGNADANVINYVMSYNGGSSPNTRMIEGLEFLDTPYEEETGALTYLISNVDADGNIVPMYTGIEPERALSVDDMLNFYKIPSIGYVRNLETHIFQVTGEGALGTVEWVAMNDAAINVFIPYYPMLTTDVDASYKLSTEEAVFTEEVPAEGLFYPTTTTRRVDGERVTVEGYKVLPANWADSYYWSYDALSNLVMYGGYSEEKIAQVLGALEEEQAAINASFAEVAPTLESAEDASAVITAWCMEKAAEAHELAVTLTAELTE